MGLLARTVCLEREGGRGKTVGEKEEESGQGQRKREGERERWRETEKKSHTEMGL